MKKDFAYLPLLLVFMGLLSCAPYRASLLTGNYSTTHGLLLNDIQLDPIRLNRMLGTANTM